MGHDMAKIGHPGNASLELSAEGERHLKAFEGLRLRAYRDPKGILTIGYGTTAASGVPVEPGMTITREQATEYMRRTVRAIYGAKVKELVRVSLLQGEYDALVGFVYNVGPAAFANSRLLRWLNKGDYASVPAELLRWCDPKNPAVTAGLLRRRRAEGDMWARAGRRNRASFVGDVAALEIGTAPTSEESSIDEIVDLRAAPTPPTSSKSPLQSTTVGAAGAVAVSTTTLVADKYETIQGFIDKGTWFHYLLAAVTVAGLAWIAYARLYRDQDALLG